MATLTMDEKLKELVLFGIDHGINSIKDGNEPLIPFVMTLTNGEMVLKRFMADTTEEAVSLAQEHLTNLSDKPEFAILVYDGYITMEGTKSEAIMADSYDLNDTKAYCLAQRYKPKKFLSRFKEIGSLVCIDEFENILK